MYAVLSPAKKLVTPTSLYANTEPRFAADTKVLVDVMQTKSPLDLQALMGISESLSILNADRYETFGENRTPSALTFAGDTYQGLDANSLKPDDLEYAQEHLGILSGLYGLLRPLDSISPYRLEMGTKLATDRGKNLYAFWGTQITQAIEAHLHSSESSALVNLASKEYFSVVQPKGISVPVITPVFKDVRKGVPKVISFLAKRARGMMARYIVEKRLKNPESLTLFDSSGYRYDPSTSTATTPVFIREE